jgi:hypothetical protein
MVEIEEYEDGELEEYENSSWNLLMWALVASPHLKETKRTPLGW